jgi:GTP-binding protein SAR1
MIKQSPVSPICHISMSSSWWQWLTDQCSLMWQALRGRRARILFLGLDNAGKTTLLHLMHDGHMHQHPPTGHATSEEMTLGSLRITALDVGGHKSARQIWRNYYTTVNALVFLVDAADQARLAEAKRELDALLSDDAIRYVPMLVLGNKMDRPNSLSERDLRESLGLQCTAPHPPAAAGIRPIERLMCSLVRQAGYGDGILWLSKQL